MVSIHTLTRRVTLSGIVHDLNTDVSIHTLTRRVTKLAEFYPYSVLVSIHTLTRRVTDEQHTIKEIIREFGIRKYL